MDEFSKTTEIVRKIVKECPWGKEQTIDKHIEKLEGEIEELKKAFNENNVDDLKEELGDVFYDALFLLLIAEKEHDADIEQIIRKVREKIERRSPWVFGDVKAKTREEADKIWHEMKKKEKELMDNIPNK